MQVLSEAGIFVWPDVKNDYIAVKGSENCPLVLRILTVDDLNSLFLRAGLTTIFSGAVSKLSARQPGSWALGTIVPQRKRLKRFVLNGTPPDRGWCLGRV